MIQTTRNLAIACFILSGAASVSYQLIWLREAFTHFGVITPVISVLLSVFMLGLATGTLLSGRIAKKLSTRQALHAYAWAECAIAFFALIVPALLRAGYEALLAYDSLESMQYLFLSAFIMAAALLPACILIGATLPLMMRVLENSSTGKNFGILYFANCVGALIGCLLPLLLIELIGMRCALNITGLCNLAAALLAFQYLRTHSAKSETQETDQGEIGQGPEIIFKHKAFLFLTGFATIGSELLWVKGFTPATGSNVYGLACVLAAYLAATIAGNYAYLRTCALLPRTAIALLPFASLLAVAGISIWSLQLFAAGAVASIMPLSFLLGYLTPHIIDTASNGHPQSAARAYTYNFAGCILGPLLTGYFLFPIFGLKGAFAIHAAILTLAVLAQLGTRLQYVALAATAIAASFSTYNYEDYQGATGLLLRDRVGYVAATGAGLDKSLSVNGINMTVLTTMTKNMIHLPTVMHTGPARSALILCMGMGTTLRSATRWPDYENITMVELSRAVTQTFPYFYDDATKILSDPRVHMVIDDGRRFLLRNKTTYDVITIDPPPPLEASGSGLLYSSEFMGVIASRLNKDGIFAHWIPTMDNNGFMLRRVLAAMTPHFKYVKIYQSLQGRGTHILASNSPIADITAEQFTAKIPAPVQSDLLEFYAGSGLGIDAVVVPSLIARKPEDFMTRPQDYTTPITDDRLYNEFFLLAYMGLINRD